MVGSMSVDVRNVREDELPAFLEALTTAFLERPDVQKVAEELKPLWDLERVWAAFDGPHIRGTFRSWATELTVPGGGRLPAAAIAAVTVMPTHRRRGILRAMTAAEHGAIRARGEAIGLLYASEYPIYGRVGYGVACRNATWTLDALGTAFSGAAVSGVEIVMPSADTADQIKAVYEAWRLCQPGEIRRREFRWQRDLGLMESVWETRWKGFLALHRDSAGSVDGYVRYRTEEKWEKRQPRAVLSVDELHALSDDAYQALWRFVSEIDLVATVKAEGRRISERLPWLLTNARAALMSELGDGLWLRLLDIPRALEARTYERTAKVVLEVIDEEAAGGRVRLLLDASPDGVACRPTADDPDLTLHVSALSAAYLGGTRLRDAVLARGLDEHRPGALAETDALLRTSDEPWCSTFF
jgi:predicted acetyltransferase